MKSTQSLPEKDAGKQLKEFERQPAKTKELERLEDQAEKSTGRERVDSNQKIQAETGSERR